MTMSRRTALKVGLGTGAAPLLLGHPLLAEAAGSPRAPANTAVIKARPLPMEAVRLTGGPLAHAQQLDARYLLELEPDRMLAYYRKRAGLPSRRPSPMPAGMATGATSRVTLPGTTSPPSA